MRSVRESRAWPATKPWFEYLVLTATRNSEARLATWDEVDLASATREIPGSRMKAGKPHRVPFSARALEVLVEAREAAGGARLLFPNSRAQAAVDREGLHACRDRQADRAGYQSNRV